MLAKDICDEWVEFVIHLSGHLQVEGIDGLKAVFSSNFPLPAVKSKWKGLQQGLGGSLYNPAYCHQVINTCEHGVHTPSKIILSIPFFICIKDFPYINACSSFCVDSALYERLHSTLPCPNLIIYTQRRTLGVIFIACCDVTSVVAGDFWAVFVRAAHWDVCGG